MDDDELRKRAEAFGVAHGFHDIDGQWRQSPIESVRKILAAMGADPDDPHPPSELGRGLVVSVEHSRPSPDSFRGATVLLEAGNEAALPELLPGDLPVGYHTLILGNRRLRLAVTPDRAYLPPLLAGGGSAWGIAAQLYAVRSEQSLGIGDFADLARLPAALASPDFVLVNPLHAPLPGVAQQPSPYFASSRRFRSPLFIALDDVPDRAHLSAVEARRIYELGVEGRELNALATIDRDAVWRVKSEALGLLHAAACRTPGRASELAAFRAQTPALELFATFCVISEQQPVDWRRWPDALCTADASALNAFAQQHAERVDFHAYLQFVAEEQFASLPRLPLGIITDLAVGSSRDGFDAWALQGVIAEGISVGAPPDPLGPLGQDWGLPPFVPARLSELGYEPFAQILRANMTHAAGLRIDHVMGFSRLFWIPRGAEPDQGVYVHYPLDDLLGIVALESQRAGCLVIGEDLGTVEPYVREALAARDILSYKLTSFEDRPAAEYPRAAMAVATTHDLPTTPGFFSGDDTRYLREIGVLSSELAADLEWHDGERRQRLRERLASEAIDGAWSDDVREITRATHEFIACTPSMLVCASLDDVVGTHVRPNVPGTVDEHPNWRIALPLTLEQIAADERVARALAPFVERGA